MKLGVIRFYKEVSMSLGHNGLRIIAAKDGVNIDLLNEGQFVIYLNKAMSAFKVFAANNVVAHYKAPRNSNVDMNALVLLPQVFGSTGKLSYDKALKVYLQSRLK